MVIKLLRMAKFCGLPLSSEAIITVFVIHNKNQQLNWYSSNCLTKRYVIYKFRIYTL